VSEKREVQLIELVDVEFRFKNGVGDKEGVK
jgi:hypothetical protein